MSALPRDDKGMFEDSVIASILESIRDMSTRLGNLSAKQDSIEKSIDKIQENVEENTKAITGFHTIGNQIPKVASVIKIGAGLWVTSIVGISWLIWHIVKYAVINFPQILH